MRCENCRRNYKMLTEKGSCAFCFQKEHGKWPKEFSEMKRDGKK